MRSGNINLINDVMKAMHSSGHKIDQVIISFDSPLWLCTRSAPSFKILGNMDLINDKMRRYSNFSGATDKID